MVDIHIPQAVCGLLSFCKESQIFGDLGNNRDISFFTFRMKDKNFLINVPVVLLPKALMPVSRRMTLCTLY